MSQPKPVSDPGRTPGRPPVRDARRKEIYNAVEQCLFELGLANTTLEAIAKRAGMTRSAISHFVGNRDAVIDAAIARSVDRFVGQMRSTVAAAPPQEQLERFISFVLQSDVKRLRLITVMDEVIAHAHRDEHARDQLREGYTNLQAFVEQITRARFPEAGPAECATVATALIFLLREFDRVRSIGATDTPLKQRRQVRQAADLLISSLAG